MEKFSIESEYKFGSGRYWQQFGALSHAGEEVKRLGKKAYIIGGRTALSLAEPAMVTSLKQSGIVWEEERYSGLPSLCKAQELSRRAADTDCDVIVGVGGGRAIDLAKMVAVERKCPVIAVPTSAATCAAFAPLSILYHEDGRYDRCVRHGDEVNAVLVDMSLQVQQPPRLLASGILDAMAKCIEIANGRSELTLDDTPVSLHSAFAFAQYTYDVLEKYGYQAIDDLRAGQSTKCLDDVIFVNIALTGIISGITQGKGQTALAHALYDASRTWFTREAQGFLHGEIVAVGLLGQLVYNGRRDRVAALKQYMRGLNIPCSLRDIGIEPSRTNLETLFHAIQTQLSLVSDEERSARLYEALESIGGDPS